MSLSGQSVHWMNKDHLAGNPTRPDTNDRCLEVLGLTYNPFSMAPDIVNFYSSPKVETTVVEVLQMVETRMGFALLYGDVGLGKTTISRRILFELERRGIQTSLVFNTFFQGADLISQINNDFDNPVDSDSLKKQMEALNNFLLNERAKGNNCVIIIDDAQSLSIESLELVRQISNMETGIDKIVQIILVGQPELEEKLNRYELRQLKSRIVLKRGFKPYTLKESGAYIRSKLERGGDESRLTVTDAAVRLVHKASRGFPRRINVIMGRSLYAAVSLKTRRMNYDVIELALKDMDESEIFVPVTSRTGVRLFVASIFAIAIGLPFAAQYFDFSVPSSTAVTSMPKIDGSEGNVAQKATVTQSVLEEISDRSAPVIDQNYDAGLKEYDPVVSIELSANNLIEPLKEISAQPVTEVEASSQGGELEVTEDVLLEEELKTEAIVAVEVNDSLSDPLVAEDSAKAIVDQPSVSINDVASVVLLADSTVDESNVSLVEADDKVSSEVLIDDSITAFLQAYDLDEYTASFASSLRNRDLRQLSVDILTHSGLRLVTLPSELDEVRSRYATLEHSAGSGAVGEFLLFWKPKLWSEESFSSFYRKKEIVELQRQLKSFGIYRNALDGIVGTQTNAAVEKFQQTVGLPLTARPDTETLFLLEFLSQEKIIGSEDTPFSVTAE